MNRAILAEPGSDTAINGGVRQTHKVKGMMRAIEALIENSSRFHVFAFVWILIPTWRGQFHAEGQCGRIHFVLLYGRRLLLFASAWQSCCGRPDDAGCAEKWRTWLLGRTSRIRTSVNLPSPPTSRTASWLERRTQEGLRQCHGLSAGFSGLREHNVPEANAIIQRQRRDRQSSFRELLEGRQRYPIVRDAIVQRLVDGHTAMAGEPIGCARERTSRIREESSCARCSCKLNPIDVDDNAGSRKVG